MEENSLKSWKLINKRFKRINTDYKALDKLNKDAMQEEHKKLTGRWYSKSLKGMSEAQMEDKLNLKIYKKTTLDLEAIDKVIEDSKSKELGEYRKKFKIGFDE